MQTRMTTNSIINTKRYMDKASKVKPVDAPKPKGLLFKPDRATMKPEDEPESVRLVRLVQKAMETDYA
jgi:hypothetical protein